MAAHTEYDEPVCGPFPLARRLDVVVGDHSEYVAQNLRRQLVDAGETVAEHSRMAEGINELLVDPFELQGYSDLVRLRSIAEKMPSYSLCLH